MLEAQLRDLEALVSAARRDEDVKTAYERLVRWKERTSRLLAETVHPNEAVKLAQKRKGSFIIGEPLRNLADEAAMYGAFLQSLKEEIEAHSDEVLQAAMPSETGDPVASVGPIGTSHSVFIVHGHDELNLLRIKELLKDRWNLEPIVLSGEAGKGRTLIEKFEDEAQRGTFAFVLLTPDDIVTDEEGRYAQARPNVIFELGSFYGRLGRERVCILFKRGTRIHSDLNGISRIEFAANVAERVMDIERELVGARLLGRPER